METSGSEAEGWAGLPLDLVTEVTHRLPPHSVPAFKFGCKHWNASVREGVDRLAPRLLDPSLAASFPNLQRLDLTTCCEPGPARVAALRPLRSLTHLTLRLPERGAQALAVEIAELSQLTSLDVSGSRTLADEQLVILAQQRRLQIINLTDCSGVTDVGILVMASLLPCLRAVHVPLVECLDTHTKVSDEACAALATLPALQTLDLRNHQGIGPGGIDSLASGAARRSLRHLRLGNCPALCAEGVDALTRLPNLEELELGFTGTLPLWNDALPAGCLAPLTRLKKLHVLRVTGCNWEAANDRSDDRVTALINLSSLEELDVSSPGRRRMKETCQRLDCFPMASLTRLDISRTDMGGAQLAPLAKAHRLQHLDCHDCCRLTCESLTLLGGLTDLRSLCLDDCEGLLPDGADSMRFLSHLTRMEAISWSNRNGAPTWIASEQELHDNYSRAARVLAHVASMPKLRRLQLCRQSLDPLSSTLGALSCATALEDVDLGGCFSDCPAAFNEALTALGALSRLSRLSLEATPVDGSGLHGFCSSLTGLTELVLSRTNLSSDDMIEVTTLRALRVLRMDEQKPSGVGDEGLRRIATLPNLARLSLGGNCDVSILGLQALARAPRLTALDLSGSVDIDIPLALKVLQSCRQLGELVLGDPAELRGLYAAPKAVHRSDISHFRSRLPLLRRLSLGSQVHLVSSRRSYALSFLQNSLQTAVIEAVQAYVALQIFYRKLSRWCLASRMQQSIQ